MAIKKQSGTVSPLVIEAGKQDRGAALAFFLLDNTGSIFECWSGYMSTADQRAVFGRVLGKGLFFISGSNELVSMSVSMCFGTMRDFKFHMPWSELAARQVA